MRDVSKKIGLISDVHATAGPLEEALSIFAKEGADTVFCAGDIAGYGEELDKTIEILMAHRCQTILGNHDVWLLNDPVEEERKWLDIFFRRLPSQWEETIEGKRCYGVHGSPPQSMMNGIKLLDQEGEVSLYEKEFWTRYLEEFTIDVLIVGHTHQVFAEMLGNTLVINPGSTKFNHSCAILSLPEMKIQFFSLSKRIPIKAWNWGMIRRKLSDLTQPGKISGKLSRSK